MEFLGRIISYVFHPVFMPVAGLLLIYAINDDVRAGTDAILFERSIYLLTAITCIILLTTLIMRSQGVISSLDTRISKERVLLYTISLVCYLFFYALLIHNDYIIANLHGSVVTSIFGALSSILLTLICTLFFRISAHMVGIAGIAGILFALQSTTLSANPLYFVGIVILCGIVGTARLITQSHSLKEIVAGFCLGFICTFITVNFGIYLVF